MDYNKFLDILPPPPKIKKANNKRGKTRQHISTGRESLFVRNVEQKCSEYYTEETKTPMVPPITYKKQQVPIKPKLQPILKFRGIAKAMLNRHQGFNVNELRINRTHLLSSILQNSNVVLKKSNICKDYNMPESTNINCFWCRHPFKCKPVSCPWKANVSKKKFCCEGIFCSYSCASAFAVNSRDCRFRFSGSLLVCLRKYIDGISASVPLTPAAHWSVLKAYGGYLDITEFRQTCCRRVRSIPDGINVYAFGYNLFHLKKENINKIQIYDLLPDANYGRGHTMKKESFIDIKKHAITRTKSLKRCLLKSKRCRKTKFSNVTNAIKNAKKKCKYKKIKF